MKTKTNAKNSENPSLILSDSSKKQRMIKYNSAMRDDAMYKNQSTSHLKRYIAAGEVPKEGRASFLRPSTV